MVARTNAKQWGITEAGHAWLKLYLNPMGAEEPALCGYPDGAAVRTCLADYSVPFTIGFPTSQSSIYYSHNPQRTNTVTDDDYAKIQVWLEGNITVLIYATPLLRHVAFVRIYPTTPTSIAFSGEIPLLPRMFPEWSLYTSSGGMAAEGDTPGYMQSWIRLDNVNEHALASKEFRVIARGFTGIYSAPALETQGFVTAAQMENIPSLDGAQTKVLGSATVIASDGTLDAVPAYVTGPLGWYFLGNNSNDSPASLVETYHNAYQSKVTDGFYMPIYDTKTDNVFTTPRMRHIGIVQQSSTDNLEDTDPTADTNYRLTWGILDTPIGGFNTGVVWLEGISPKFELRLKTRTVVQYVSQSGSILANFTKHEPAYDELAITTARRLRTMLAHAYPAKYNDWGWLGDLIDAGISMIPGVGTAYKVLKPFVKPLVKPAWNWFSGKVKDYFGDPVVSDGDVYFDAKS